MTNWLVFIYFMMYFYFIQRELPEKNKGIAIVFLLIGALTSYFKVVWVAGFILICYLTYLCIRYRKFNLGLNLGWLILTMTSFFLWSDVIEIILWLGLITLDLSYLWRQTNWQVSGINFVFELILAMLYLTTQDVTSKFLFLLLFASASLMKQQLLAYLFKETEMVYARSLDQIMTNYIEEVNLLYQNIRGWRHDYHSHLQALKVYLNRGQVTEIKNYLNQLEDKLVEIDQIVTSGNTMLDAIVNSKLSIANKKEIEMNVKVFVGQQPLINDVDLCVILGNVLDNGIEACEEIEEVDERIMRVYISILKQQLYISVTNTRPLTQQIKDEYTSTKNDRRGLGIRRIDQLVRKYSGVINRQFEEGVFVTEILLPLVTISER